MSCGKYQMFLAKHISNLWKYRKVKKKMPSERSVIVYNSNHNGNVPIMNYGKTQTAEVTVTLDRFKVFTTSVTID